MHDAGVVIGHPEIIHVVGRILAESKVISALNIVQMNADVAVTVGSALLMLEANRVANFVNNIVLLLLQPPSSDRRCLPQIIPTKEEHPDPKLIST